MKEKITVSDVIAANPCGLHDEDDGVNYTPKRITRLFDGREALALEEVLALDIPVQDKAWAAFYVFGPEHRLCVECAWRFAAVMAQPNEGERTRAVRTLVHRWLDGEQVSGEELRNAAAGVDVEVAAQLVGGDDDAAARAAAVRAAFYAAAAAADATYSTYYAARTAAARAAYYAAAAAAADRIIAASSIIAVLCEVLG